MMNNLFNTIDKSLILVYNIDILKERDFIMESKEEARDRLLSEVKRRHSVLDMVNLYCIYSTVMSKAKQNLNNKS